MDHNRMRLFIKTKPTKTTNLIIRPWREDDLNALYEIGCEKEVANSAGWERFYNINDAKKFLDMLIKNNSVNAIATKDDKAIGIFDFLWSKKYFNHIEIGYSLNKNYWGKGLMSEAANTIMDELKKRYNPIGFTAIVSSDNIRSIALLNKLGFIRKEKIKNDIYYVKK
ncbi:MAG: GNAT family N-acetyltransferase [Ezakiella sp.]|nr:GNAT family N-acetyltransferase [Ezakiella sp.]